ncbi:hypothetical protein ABK040_015122 [Willaertia magna]
MITFALITDGTSELASGPKDNMELSQLIMNKIVPKVSKDDMEKRTLKSEEMEIHYKKSGKYIYFCVASQDHKKRVCWAFIDDLESTFSAVTKKNDISSNRKIIKQKVDKYNDENVDKITQINNKLDSVKDTMVDNIDKILDRGEKLDNLYETTYQLQETSKDFEKGSRKLKNRMLIKVIVIGVIICVIATGVVIIAVLAGCGFPSFSRCGGSSSK